MMHFGMALQLRALASKWAVRQSLKMLHLVKHCLNDRFHVKILPRKLSVQRGESILDPADMTYTKHCTLVGTQVFTLNISH